jgi:hypothetical protein
MGVSSEEKFNGEKKKKRMNEYIIRKKRERKPCG